MKKIPTHEKRSVFDLLSYLSVPDTLHSSHQTPIQYASAPTRDTKNPTHEKLTKKRFHEDEADS